jgi:hypothetical protein
MSTLDELTNEALSLAVDERVILAQRVWDSMKHFENAEPRKPGWNQRTGDGTKSKRGRSNACRRTK